MLKYFLICCCLINLSANAQVYKFQKGNIAFTSDAPLEIIKAQTKVFKAIYQVDKNQFIISIMMNSFTGFNSELQNEHYNENYLETTKYPDAKYVGKILDPVDFVKKGDKKVRVKGKFTMHGVTVEKIINCNVKILDANSFVIDAEFELNLAEHNINIPKIVNKKIAENIRVKFNAILKVQ
jgi:polyisoprenoid-binding protein YceI